MADADEKSEESVASAEEVKVALSLVLRTANWV